MKNDKYAFLYEYARDGFEDELKRFKNVEDKASKFISLLSIAFVLFSAVIKWSLPALLPLDNVEKWLVIGVITITYLSFISSWSFLFRSLKFVDMPRLPLDEAFINDFKQRDLPTNHYQLSVTCSRALSYAREANTKKSEYLQKAYKEITFFSWLLSISLISIFSLSIQEANMPENEKGQEATQQTSQAPEPDFDVTAPEVVFVLDHAIREKNEDGSE